MLSRNYQHYREAILHGIASGQLSCCDVCGEPLTPDENVYGTGYNTVLHRPGMTACRDCGAEKLNAKESAEEARYVVGLLPELLTKLVDQQKEMLTLLEQIAKRASP